MRDDHRDDLVRFLTRRDEQGWCFPTIVDGDTVTLDPDYLTGMGYRPPTSLLTLAPADLRLEAKLEGWTWREAGLVLVGQAYITNVESGRRRRDHRRARRGGAHPSSAGSQPAGA